MPWKPVAALALGTAVAVLVAAGVLALGRTSEPAPPGIVQLEPGGDPDRPRPDAGPSAGVVVPPPVPLDTTPTTTAPPPPPPSPAPPIVDDDDDDDDDDDAEEDDD